MIRTNARGELVLPLFSVGSPELLLAETLAALGHTFPAGPRHLRRPRRKGVKRNA